MGNNFKHGTSSAYSYHKCRCEECVAWKKRTSREYYERNREVVQKRTREYYEANREAVDAKKREYRQRDPERWRTYAREYQRERAEHVNAKNRKWRRENPWRHWFTNWQYRERKRGEYYAPEVLEWIKSLEGSSCTYCGAPAETIDHILARASGGSNDRDNLAPACNRCNKRKQDLPLEVFIRRLREEY